MKIGTVAKQTGLGIETIRYYERQGLLDQPARKASGYRDYDERVIARLAFIIRAKELGFTLVEIAELLGLWFDASTTCCDVRRKAERKIQDVETKIKSLQSIKRSLKQLIDQCQQRGTLEECPLLQGLMIQETGSK